jgi:limonene-1,2-epoxide hydrolase
MTNTLSPQKIVEEFLAALSDFDLDAAAERVHEDCVYQNVPFHREAGKEKVMAVLKIMMKRLEVFDVEMLHIAANGNVVLTERIDTLGGRFFKADINLMGVFVIKDGKIIEWRDYFDWSSSGGRFLKGIFGKLFAS